MALVTRHEGRLAGLYVDQVQRWLDPIGDPSSYVFIVGVGATANGGAAFTCIERASAGRFSVPTYVLSAIPVTTGESLGFLSVNSVSEPVTFTATGLDLGTVLASAGASKTVTFR